MDVRTKGNTEERRLAKLFRKLGLEGSKRTGFIAGERDVRLELPSASLRLESKRDQQAALLERDFFRQLERKDAPVLARYGMSGSYGVWESDLLLSTGATLWWLLDSGRCRDRVDVPIFTIPMPQPKTITKWFKNAHVVWHRRNYEKDNDALVWYANGEVVSHLMGGADKWDAMSYEFYPSGKHWSRFSNAKKRSLRG